MLEDITERLKSLPCLRLLSQTGDKTFVPVTGLETGAIDACEVRLKRLELAELMLSVFRCFTQLAQP